MASSWQDTGRCCASNPTQQSTVGNNWGRTKQEKGCPKCFLRDERVLEGVDLSRASTAREKGIIQKSGFENYELILS